MSNKFEIDFIVPWVDDKDPVWQEKKAQHTGSKPTSGNEDARYRDWDTLKYWFRGVEKYAPWVRNIYFVTDNQKPSWLNTDHPKLKWVKHTDFIPQEYLPTFSANPIEWNLHRIEGLSENFVYFNDDVFLINDTKPEDFFKDDLPCDSAVLYPMLPKGFFSYMMFNNYHLINRHFSMNEVIKKHRKKWLKGNSVLDKLKNIWFGRQPFVYGITDFHIQNSYKKSTFETLWKNEQEIIHNTCLNKSRTKEDVTIWCVRYWRLMNGEFSPKKPIGKLFHTETLNYNNDAIDYIKKKKGKVVCINDTENEDNFELHKKMVVEAFDELFPEKSAFEL